MDEAEAGQLGEDIQVAQDEVVFTDDRHGVAVAQQHLQDGPGDAELALYGLVAVGIAGKHNGLRLIAAGIELALKHDSGIALDDDLALESESGAVAPVLVCIVGVAVEADVLAALVDR